MTGLCKRLSAGRWGPWRDGDPARAASRQAAGSLPPRCAPGEEAAVIALGDSGGFSFFFLILLLFFFCSSLLYFLSFYKKHLTAAGSWLQPRCSPAPSCAPAPHGTQGRLGPPSTPSPPGWAGGLRPHLTPGQTPPQFGELLLSPMLEPGADSQDCHPARGSCRRAAWSPPTPVTPRVGFVHPSSPTGQDTAQHLPAPHGDTARGARLGGSLSVPACGKQGAAPNRAVGPSSCPSARPELAGSHEQTSSGRLGRA